MSLSKRNPWSSKSSLLKKKKRPKKSLWKKTRASKTKKVHNCGSKKTKTTVWRPKSSNNNLLSLLSLLKKSFLHNKTIKSFLHNKTIRRLFRLWNAYACRTAERSRFSLTS
jgi:hypothetical protein